MGPKPPESCSYPYFLSRNMFLISIIMATSYSLLTYSECSSQVDHG